MFNTITIDIKSTKVMKIKQYRMDDKSDFNFKI